jgi:c-di-GMP phosphodiesterase
MHRQYKLFLILSLIVLSIFIFKINFEMKYSQKIENMAIESESKSLADLIIAFRTTYQNVFIRNHTQLDETTFNFLPVKTMNEMSDIFSKRNIDAKIQTVSDRPRNKINLANERQKKLIEYFKTHKEKPYIFKKENGKFYYSQPLKINKLCLKCHGEREKAPLIIRENYNTAYGYKLGDVRGIIDIELTQTEFTHFIENSRYKKFFTTFILISLILLVLFTYAYFTKKHTDRLTKEIEKKTNLESLLKEEVQIKSTLSRSLHIEQQQLQEKNIELEKQLYIDSLTKLGSYYALSQDIDKCKTTFPVLMLINIDNFKNINNLYGYETGNDVLIEFASCLKSFINDDTYKAYRLFADEFIIFQNCQYADIEDFHGDLLRLKETIDKHKFFINPLNDYLNLDITMGISIGQENPIGTVDTALRYAKKHKLPFQTYNSELNNEISLENTIKWKKRLKNAIEDNRVVPVFQPIVDRDTNIIKYEVLIRLQSEDNHNELIPPHEFLEEAVNAKQYNNLMKIVFDKTFEIMKTSNKLFSINLSYNDIFNNTLIQHLKEKFTKDPQIASRIVIEILETDEIENSELMKKFIEEFRQFRVKIAIDDFGTGHSNLSHILQVNPDYLKIDGAFIKNINEDRQSYAMVKSIISFCKELNITVIAEFVHSREVFDILFELGIDEFQGYYFSPPKRNIL